MPLNLADILKNLDIDAADIQAAAPSVVEFLDLIISQIPNPLVRIGWKLVRAFLLSRAGAEAVHGALVAKGMQS